MTRKEALSWLHVLKWHLVDAKQMPIAWEVENVEQRVASGWSPSLLREYARFFMPNGKRGHIRLVLLPPYEARALAMLYKITTTIEED